MKGKLPMTQLFNYKTPTWFVVISPRVKLANLTPGTDTAALARTIVSKVEVIRPDRCPEVEQILDYLKNRAASAKHGRRVYSHNVMCGFLSWKYVIVEWVGKLVVEAK